MTLQSNFSILIDHLDRLARALENLLWAVVEAQPETEKGHSLILHYDQFSEDLIGLLKEANIEAGRGYQAAGQRIDQPAVIQALVKAHSLFLDVSEQFQSELISTTMMENLNSLIQEDRTTWEYWVKGVADALENCLQPIRTTNRALLSCWQAVSEHENSAVSVKNVQVGQLINMDKRQSEQPILNR